MYRIIEDAELLDGPVLAKSMGRPSIMDILGRLEAMKGYEEHDSDTETVEMDWTFAPLDDHELQQSDDSMNSDRRALDTVRPSLSQDISQQSSEEELFHLINWDTAVILTPTTMQPMADYTSCAKESMASSVLDSAVREYSLRIARTQADQARTVMLQYRGKRHQRPVSESTS